MENNVINFDKSKDKIIQIPNDLMTFRELKLKHGFKYGYLYKWACLENKINIYPRGRMKLSEQEVLNFANKGHIHGRNK